MTTDVPVGRTDKPPLDNALSYDDVWAKRQFLARDTTFFANNQSPFTDALAEIRAYLYPDTLDPFADEKKKAALSAKLTAEVEELKRQQQQGVGGPTMTSMTTSSVSSSSIPSSSSPSSPPKEKETCRKCKEREAVMKCDQCGNVLYCSRSCCIRDMARHSKIDCM